MYIYIQFDHADQAAGEPLRNFDPLSYNSA